jgi:segregation and condensation protein A
VKKGGRDPAVADPGGFSRLLQPQYALGPGLNSFPLLCPFAMDYQVNLDTFRGPLDLLLYLVKRHEVDICDIPIARVAEQFQEYLEAIQLIDVELAGDFLVMASTLLEIKSKMLLPRGDEVAGEEADPRLELVRQLIQYKQFKEAALLLEAQAERQLCRLARQPVEIPAAPGPAQQPLRSVELWDLVSAFGRLMRETLALQPRQIVMDETPIHIHMERIVEQLAATPRLVFAELFTPPHTRGRLLGLFLALLELVKSRRVVAEQPALFGPILMSLAPPAQPGANGTAEPAAPPPGAT